MYFHKDIYKYSTFGCLTSCHQTLSDTAVIMVKELQVLLHFCKYMYTVHVHQMRKKSCSSLMCIFSLLIKSNLNKI